MIKEKKNFRPSSCSIPSATQSPEVCTGISELAEKQVKFICKQSFLVIK